MKEHKYRIWDVELKFFVDPCRYFIRLDGSIYFDIRDDGVNDLIEQTSKLKLMQYTGLKDKNEKDIYEGDIVVGAFSWGVYQGIVGYDEGSFHIVEHGDASFLPFCDYEASSHEVIGNIYENSELIKREIDI